MALTKIEGKLVDVQVSTNLVTPAWKKPVCGTDLSLDGSVDTTTVTTKCGSLSSRGSVAWVLTGSAIANATPGTNEISASDMGTFFQNGTQLLVKMAHTTTEALFYASAPGTVTAMTFNAGVSDNLSYDFTITLDGDLDFTA
jgi:hypothetical protein